MSLATTVVWITITTFSVINGKTVDKNSVSYPTANESTSECKADIKDRSDEFKLYRKKHKSNYAYSYKKIKCSKKKIGDFSGIFKR